MVVPNAADAGGGLARVTCGRLATNIVGARSVSRTATDRAGNSTTATVSYTVIIPLNHALSVELERKVRHGMVTSFRTTGPSV